MRFFLCVIFLVQYSYCHEDNRGEERSWREQNRSSISKRATNRNNAGPIMRPCSLRDTNCTRHFFAQNYMCSPMYGPAPDPYIIKTLPLNLPHCNITLILIDAHIRGLNSGKINEFYINTKTDYLVFEVEFEKLVVETPVTTAVYHLKGQEPIELSAKSIITFKGLSLTLTVNNFSDVHAAKPYVAAYFSDPKPPVKVGAGITGTKDPVLQRMNKKWLGEIGLSAMEAFIVQAPEYMSKYLNSMICDFKLV